MAVVGNTRKANVGSNLEKMKGLKVTDLLVPGLFILVFLLLTFFVYVPSLTESNEMRHELSEVRSKQLDLERNIQAIAPLVANKAQLNTDLVKTEKIIPQNLDVADFSYYVDKIARDSGLEFQEIQQQNDLNSLQNQVQSKLQLDATVSSVRGPITYGGTYDQIVEFLDHLQRESPYIVEVVELDLASNKATEREDEDEDGDENQQNQNDNQQNDEDDEDERRRKNDVLRSPWIIQLSISGYFIPDESEVTTSTIYQKMTPYTDYDDILKIFDFKAAILDETGDQSTPDDRDENAVDEEDEDEERNN